jgi:hypothetical protein
MLSWLEPGGMHTFALVNFGTGGYTLEPAN